jgi:hypothetical protein
LYTRGLYVEIHFDHVPEDHGLYRNRHPAERYRAETVYREKSTVIKSSKKRPRGMLRAHEYRPDE